MNKSLAIKIFGTILTLLIFFSFMSFIITARNDLIYYKRTLQGNYINHLKHELDIELDHLNQYNQLLQKYPKDKEINTEFQICLYRTYFHAMVLKNELDVDEKNKKYILKEITVESEAQAQTK